MPNVCAGSYSPVDEPIFQVHFHVHPFLSEGPKPFFRQYDVIDLLLLTILYDAAAAAALNLLISLLMMMNQKFHVKLFEIQYLDCDLLLHHHENYYFVFHW